MMLLCPSAWGLGQVVSSLQCSPADSSCELRRKKVIKFTLRSSCCSLQSGHTRAGLTHLHPKKHAEHLVGPGMWRPAGFCAGPDLCKLHLDTVFLFGLSQYSLSALVCISKLLGHRATAFPQHGEPQRV